MTMMMMVMIMMTMRRRRREDDDDNDDGDDEVEQLAVQNDRLGKVGRLIDCSRAQWQRQMHSTW